MRARNQLFAMLSVVGLMLFSFVATAFAAGAATPDDGSLLDLARPVFDQIMKGHYIAAAAFALVLAVALVKRYHFFGAKFDAFVHSDAGGALTTLVMSFGGAVATATMGDAPWHWSMLWMSATVAFAAAGGYTIVKKLLVEPLRASTWYQTKAPEWFKAAMQVVLWIFDKKNAGADVQTDATKAGDAAVAANPPGGADAVVGKPEEF